MQLEIRSVRPSDAEAISTIYQDPEVYAGVLGLPYSYSTEEEWRSRLEQNSSGTADLVLAAIVYGRIVGTAGLHSLSKSVRRRHCMGIGIGIASEFQNQGIGSKLLQALCEYADNWAQVLRIELTVYTDNKRAIALYQKFGFAIEGTHSAFALRAGQYVDAYSMARLHPHPPLLPSVVESD
jgi:L-phenylalanine/L-methionine N-acetyltransferase